MGPIVIAGNKCDLRNPDDSSQVTKASAEELAAKWKCKFFETSAKEKINNEQCFYEVVRNPKNGKICYWWWRRQKGRLQVPDPVIYIRLPRFKGFEVLIKRICFHQKK